jgi:hypothetical protein
MKMLIRVLLLCLALSCQSLFAIEIERLYEIEVIAESDSKQDRQVAFTKALEVILTRILAGDNILQDKTVRVILSDAKRYVSEFQYALVNPKRQGNSHARLLRVLFNETLLIDTLRAGQLEFWNEIRTRTLVWLVVEEYGKKQFFDAGLMPKVEAAMIYAAKQKSLPMLYPIQDLKEKRDLTISDVLSAYSEHLLEVSLRYDVVSTLAGKLVKTEHCWKAEWTFYFDGNIEQWKSQCDSINEATLNGFQGVYDRLSKYYAVKSNKSKMTSAIIKIANIKGISALEHVSSYLESLAMISTANWIGKEGKYNLYRLFFLGKQYQLSNKLMKDDVLIAESFSEQSSDEVTYKLK